MVLSDQLLSKLVCPTCKKSFEYDKENHKLICNECQVWYKVKNNIPVLLSDEAEKL